VNSPQGSAPPSADLASWGIDPAWSRRLDVPSHDGSTHAWHLLDTGTPDPQAVVLCVHGNPTWSAAWEPLLRRLGSSHRVIAVDQLSMGFSDLVGPRNFADRVADLHDVITALGNEIPGLGADVPLVLAGHDWGGAVVMGSAVDHPERIKGLILCNTGIRVPPGRSAPGIIRLAAAAPLRDLVCRRTRLFVEGTIGLSRRRLDAAQRAALRAPYRTAERRRAIADFVGDIPLQADHPSADRLDDVVARLPGLDVPVLLAAGSADPVFNDDFAADLAALLPRADLHRFADCGHLVVLESSTSSRRAAAAGAVSARADVAGVAAAWLDDLDASSPPLGAAPTPTVAVDSGHPLYGVDPWSVISGQLPTDGGRLTWGELADRIEHVAVGLRAAGLQPGDRVAVVTPPGVDLPAVVYGIWRAGGVTVIADRGLGVRGVGRALRGARPQWIVGPRAALTVARAARWTPGATALDVTALVGGGSEPRAGSSDDWRWPDDDAPAALLFTSGATGAAKGVRYTHGQLISQRDALVQTYAIEADDRLVAAFAPFALYGPALGITTALPDIDVTRPSGLTHDDLVTAVSAIDATLLFASPAALANVVHTADPAAGRLTGLRLVMSAGAPVAAELLTEVAAMAPAASLHTPYGMTEVLPVADIGLDEIVAADADDPAGGVCVGRPVAGAEVRIEPIGESSRSGFGEIVVRSPWVSAGYADLWATHRAARPGGGWHRTGDVGHLDDAGRLWVEGRLAHVIGTAGGVVGPVPLERAVERSLGVRRVAAVGVGPWGQQQVVVAVETGSAKRLALVTGELAARVRQAVERECEQRVAAVFTIGALPVDIRHNAKIDRSAVASSAATLLAGGHR
jgi:acyl-CoA synthetase (AMP-forming)/AMP-acid ligase II/pimeloyl-ACP methyl ester carboxylesterase